MNPINIEKENENIRWHWHLPSRAEPGFSSGDYGIMGFVPRSWGHKRSDSSKPVIFFESHYLKKKIYIYISYLLLILPKNHLNKSNVTKTSKTNLRNRKETNAIPKKLKVTKTTSSNTSKVFQRPKKKRQRLAVSGPCRFSQAINGPSSVRPAGRGPFVAGFGAAAAGDISPNTEGSWCEARTRNISGHRYCCYPIYIYIYILGGSSHLVSGL